MRTIKFLLALLILFLLPGLAAADGHFVSATNIAFGIYDAASQQPLESLGEIMVTSSDPFVLSLDAGQNSGGNFFSRAMVFNSNRIYYNLYIDAACTMVWGDGATGTFVQSAGTNNSFKVYARVQPNQNVPPGDYSDSIIVTIEW